MMKRRTFRLVLASLAMLLLVACSSQAVRYLSYRLDPNDVGNEGDHEIILPGLATEATITLDRYGVPHIRATNEESLAMALGYMHARDRRFQMETLRLLAAGKLREMIGNQDATGGMAHLEIVSRAIGLDADAAAIKATASPQDLALLEAYAAGVNAGTALEPRPMEFRVLDYQPPPWTIDDSLRITALVSFGLNKNWEQELGRLEIIVHQLRTGGSIDRALNIWKPRYDLPPHLIGQKPEQDPFAAIPPIAPELAAYLAEYAHTMTSDLAPAETKVARANSPWDGFVHGGSNSNNWAMSGTWPGTGAAAFASDPHMPLTLPPLGYLAHVRCDNCAGGSYEVIGGGFMGLPAISFGTNGRVAWGPTSNWADVADLYVEKPVPGREGHCFDEHGQPRALEIRKEEFRIRQPDGTYEVETHNIRVSRHGVLLNDFVERLPPDFPLVALQRHRDKGKPITAIRNLYRARNVTEGRLALNDFAAMIGHWALADNAGNIAYCGPLFLPKRAHHLGTVPSPGWVADYDWHEFVPPDQMPWVENPPTGYLGSANNQVVDPSSQGWPINFEGDVAHRWARMVQVLGLGRRPRPVAEQIGDLQIDGMDMGWPEVRPLYERALAPLLNEDNRLVAAAATALLAWDGRCLPDTVGATLFNALNAALVKRTLEDEVSPQSMQFILTYFNAEPLVFGILGDATNIAWDNRATAVRETAEEEIREAFHATVQALKKKYGDDLTKWRWRRIAPFVLKHAFGGSSTLAGYVNRGPLPTLGANNTVDKNQFARAGMVEFPIQYGAVLRLAIDLSDLRSSFMSLPGGQSGRPSSEHYDDMLDFYLTGRGVTMDMDFDHIEAAAVGHLYLKPSQNPER